jgi:aspartate beta-hydroxylase
MSAHPGEDSRAHARTLARAGQLDHAERAYASVLEKIPGDPEAADFLAGCRLSRGDAAGAVTLLEGAARAHGRNAVLLNSLGIARMHARQFEGAAAALREAVALTPENFVARLFLARALEQLQRAPEALALYFGALHFAQAGGAWRDLAAVPAALRPLVGHAMQVVIAGRRELFGRALAPLRARYGAAALARVERALAIYLLDAPPEYPDPRQRPSFLFFPGLAAMPYYARERFDWLPALEARTGAIRDEMLALLDARENFEPFHKHVPSEGYLRGTRGAPAWDTFFFHRHGEPVPANAARCPATAATLATLPLSRIRGHAPECLFSVLRPGTHILPHRGVTNTRLVVHLPLIVPPDCALVVGGETHVWQEGRVVVFDDSFEHEAWNKSDQPRAMLLMDVWHPELSEAERAAVTDLVAAIGDFNDACGINQPKA